MFMLLEPVKAGNVNVIQAFREQQEEGTLTRRTNGIVYVGEEMAGTFFKECVHTEGQPPLFRTGIDLPENCLAAKTANANVYKIGDIEITDVVTKGVGSRIVIRLAS